ncbi:hypothetical protein [Pedobacter sp. UBA5917]|jgi:hypothetical protein|uniref:hypothetical protein n=1 Tax=Pedobacter sp. UBA5917 TaxID=1947061 RepID=UPI0025D8789C|nr:hypothetical protein [Pedobacter sp. UBA5917]
MTELDYFFTDGNGEDQHYKLIRFSSSGPWSVLDGDELLCSIGNENGEWAILEGELSTTMLRDAAKLIEKQHFQSLPAEIISRWPKLVHQVIANSDHEYMVVCQPDINFELFERVFFQFVPDMLKDEWQISFRVYNSDFSNDFMFATSADKQETHFSPLKKWQV